MGIFYNFPRSTGDGGYPFSGGCPVSCTRQIRWATFNDITTATAGNLIESPVNVNVAGYEQPLAKSHNVNIAFQRDIGFSTVAEIAYVGNFTWNHGRTVDVNRLPLYVYGNPANLVNNAPVNANSLRCRYGTYPGMGSVNEFVPDSMPKRCATTPCRCRSSAGCRRACRWVWRTRSRRVRATTGYDPYTDEIGGEAAIRARYWGPTADDRRHNVDGELQLRHPLVHRACRCSSSC